MEVQEIKILIFFEGNNIKLFKYDKNSQIFYVINIKQLLIIFMAFKHFKKCFVQFLDATILLGIVIRISFGYILATGRYIPMTEFGGSGNKNA